MEFRPFSINHYDMSTWQQSKSLQLIWRLSTRRFHLQVRNLQISCRDLITLQGSRIVALAVAAVKWRVPLCKVFYALEWYVTHMFYDIYCEKLFLYLNVVLFICSMSVYDFELIFLICYFSQAFFWWIKMITQKWWCLFSVYKIWGDNSLINSLRLSDTYTSMRQ